jgi:hypothetical protein
MHCSLKGSLAGKFTPVKPCVLLYNRDDVVQRVATVMCETLAGKGNNARAEDTEMSRHRAVKLWVPSKRTANQCGEEMCTIDTNSLGGVPSALMAESREPDSVGWD